MKHLRVTVQGKVYEVTVEMLDQGEQAAPVAQSQLSMAPAAASAASSPAAAASASGPGLVGSPLAGKVMGVQVTKGQAVKQGDQLVVLEAMKMNTYVQAPQDCIVAEILVSVGDAVAEGHALVRIAAA
jgi:glutaconyl-CoA/methylmalonyl-CoA decarboxylase subunit gamma